MTYDPEIWLESLTQTLKEYVEQGLNNSVLDADQNPAGLEIYEVMMEFPGPSIDGQKKMPLKKTIIHLEIDDIQTMLVGFGENTFAMNYDDSSGTVKPQEARRHMVNLDVGVWATDSTGGTTARLRAFQILNSLFSGSIATNSLRTFSNGGDGPIDIISFAGGRFTTERVNDVDVFRTIGATLEVRVFSRTALPPAEPAITEVFVEELTIPVDGP